MISTIEFIEASGNGEIVKVGKYIADGGNVNAKAVFGETSDWTALMWAAHNGHTDCVQALIAAGADVDAQTKISIVFGSGSGRTALMWAAIYGHSECVKELIAAGAALEMKDNKGRTALMWALEFKHYDIAQLLVENGAYIYAKQKDGVAAIDLCKNKRIKEKLIKISQRHITAAIKSSEKPVIIKGFDSEL